MNMHRATARDQEGVALVIALIMLVVVTLVTFASLRGTLIQERMVGTQYDRSLAFQAAEASLRHIEEKIAGSPPTVAGMTCDKVGDLKVCPKPAADAVPRWKQNTDWTDIPQADLKLQAIQSGNQYIVEYLGTDFPCDPANVASPATCKRYRVTARARPDGSNRASVMLQSVYATQ